MRVRREMEGTQDCPYHMMMAGGRDNYCCRHQYSNTLRCASLLEDCCGFDFFLSCTLMVGYDSTPVALDEICSQAPSQRRN